MDRLIEYFGEINAQYVLNDQTVVKENEIPEAMRIFYETFQHVELPYGRIYDLDTALRHGTNTNGKFR